VVELPKNYPACSESIRFRYVLTRSGSDADRVFKFGGFVCIVDSLK
jgi:hypothetical protein